MNEKNINEWEDEVEHNKPISTDGMKWKLSCKRVGNAISAKFSRLVTKAQWEEGVTKSRMLELMAKNRKLAPKSISLIYLRNPISVFLFHWIFWRYIYWFKSNEEMRPILDAVLVKQGQEATDFFGCVISLQQSNLLQEMMTSQSAGNIIQKLASEEGTTLSKPSTVT